MTPEEMALCQLSTLVFNDSVDVNLDFTYVTAESNQNQHAGVARAVDLSYNWQWDSVVFGIAGFDHLASGGESVEVTENKMIAGGICPRLLRRINYPDSSVGPDGAHHTGTEMALVARFILENNYRRVGVIAAPFHQLRSYLHLLTALHRVGSSGQSVQVFNYPGVPEDSFEEAHYWLQETSYSHGKDRGSRLAILVAEISKILQYWRKGDLISPIEALGYFVLHRS
ncbi:MAG: hypothetical protein Q7S32_00585 [bacterium]|nr:hypothetical protein [bacterium]